VAHIATSETLVPIALAELLLLRRLIVPWSGSWEAVGCRLLLLRWPDHPSARLLLEIPALIVRNNPEPLSLSGWCCHWCLSLLLCPMSYNAVLLGDGQVDQLIEAICLDSVESFPQLGIKTPVEAVSLLFIRISMVPCILAQVVEGLRILQYRVSSLIKGQKFIQLSIKNASWDVVPSEGSLEFFPRHLTISGEHSTEVIPPRPSRSAMLLRGVVGLGSIRAVSREEVKLGLDDAKPHVGIQRILCLGEQGWLRAQKLLVSCHCRRSLLLASTMLLRVGLALQELSQNLILLGHQLLHCGSWRRWRGNLLVMPATLPSCHLKTEIAAIVIPSHSSNDKISSHMEGKMP
jgi:hypothetical protein